MKNSKKILILLECIKKLFYIPFGIFYYIRDFIKFVNFTPPEKMFV